jgi:hypothetical protein
MVSFSPFRTRSNNLFSTERHEHKLFVRLRRKFENEWVPIAFLFLSSSVVRT